MILFRFICIISTFSAFVYAYGSELGNFGNNFPIEEIPFEQMILEKLKELNINNLNKEMEKNMGYKILDPNPPLGIKTAKYTRIFKFDPTYVANDDVIMPDGEKIYSKGQKINPLNYMSFERKLYFIDGSNKRQVEWFQRMVRKLPSNKYRLVIVKGSIPDLVKELNMPVYFDQFGHLVNRFRIKNVPAMVWQRKDEDVITVKEVGLRY